MNTPFRVLVIDDEVGIREGCRRVLVPQGFDVDMAENGPRACANVREARYDVLLLDIMMPGMSGIEVLRQIRQMDPDLICIVITGYATVELAIQAIREGAHDFIAKPFSADLLLQVIGRDWSGGPCAKKPNGFGHWKRKPGNWPGRKRNSRNWRR